MWSPSGARASSQRDHDKSVALSEARSHPLQLPRLYSDHLAIHHTVGNRAFTGLMTGEPPGQAHADLSSAGATSAGWGEPLDPSTRILMEQRFAADFSQVLVHADAAAARRASGAGAAAMTQGRDIYFGAGNYRPDAPWGRRLLAHELAHVIQQLPAGPTDQRSAATLERQASSAADAPALGGASSVVPGTAPAGAAQKAEPSEGNPEQRNADPDPLSQYAWLPEETRKVIYNLPEGIHRLPGTWTVRGKQYEGDIVVVVKSLPNPTAGVRAWLRDPRMMKQIEVYQEKPELEAFEQDFFDPDVARRHYTMHKQREARLAELTRQGLSVGDALDIIRYEAEIEFKLTMWRAHGLTQMAAGQMSRHPELEMGPVGAARPATAEPEEGPAGARPARSETVAPTATSGPKARASSVPSGQPEMPPAAAEPSGRTAAPIGGPVIVGRSQSGPGAAETALTPFEQSGGQREGMPIPVLMPRPPGGRGIRTLSVTYGNREAPGAETSTTVRQAPGSASKTVPRWAPGPQSSTAPIEAPSPESTSSTYQAPGVRAPSTQIELPGAEGASGTGEPEWLVAGGRKQEGVTPTAQAGRMEATSKSVRQTGKPKEKLGWREVQKAAEAEAGEYWSDMDTNDRFAKSDENFGKLVGILKQKGHAVQNEDKLRWTVGLFIDKNARLKKLWAELDEKARYNPDLRAEMDEFIGATHVSGVGTGFVESRRPDLVEFFLDKNTIVVTDQTTKVALFHIFKTVFYTEVMRALMGHRANVYGVDIDLSGQAPVATLIDEYGETTMAYPRP
jgi:hypothetical protein